MNDAWPATFDDAARGALLAGLALTPAERLAWLEEALVFVEWSQTLPRVDHGKPGTARSRPER